MEHPSSFWSGLGLGLGLGLMEYPMRSQGIVRQCDGMDKRDRAYSRPRTGSMSHGIPTHHRTMGRPWTSYSKVRQSSHKIPVSPNALCAWDWGWNWTGAGFPPLHYHHLTVCCVSAPAPIPVPDTIPTLAPAPASIKAHAPIPAEAPIPAPEPVSIPALAPIPAQEPQPQF